MQAMLEEEGWLLIRPSALAALAEGRGRVGNADTNEPPSLMTGSVFAPLGFVSEPDEGHSAKLEPKEDWELNRKRARLASTEDARLSEPDEAWDLKLWPKLGSQLSLLSWASFLLPAHVFDVHLQ